jgi:predicted metalloprotease with PDZ domain
MGSNLTPIQYTIAMPQPHTHLYHLSVEVPNVDGVATDFVLPAWAPGSYLIREYARHVQSFAACDALNGAPLSWHKTAKDTWRVEHGDTTSVRVTYQVYAHDLSVRTSHLDASHGYFNGANVFLYIPGRTAEPLLLHVQTPPGSGWRVTTGLEPHTAPDTFLANDYDELIDCPVECGTHRLRTFTVAGIEHRIAFWGHGNEDEQRIVDDTRRIVETERDLFGGLPYPHYTFILHLADRYGGLEHRNSVTNIIDRWSFQPRASYERFLELQSHELFHAWNIKRIRPAALGPFDYQRENYTRLLWTVEGVTSYYDRLLLVRAGLLSRERYLEQLAEDIVRLQSQPGRALHSLEQSSFDAWIKFYRPDEHSANSSISYYLKGSLVILLLDLDIRQRTGGARSFDDVLHWLHERYPPEQPGIPEENAYQQAIEQATDAPPGTYDDFFARYIRGTAELDYARALDAVGLRMEWSHSAGNNSAPPAWLGLTLKHEHGRTLVGSVRSDGPAWNAGIAPGDELLALDGFRINDREQLSTRLRAYRPGSEIVLALFRRDELLHLPLTLAAAPPDRLRLRRVEQPTAEQEKLYRAWLPDATKDT